MPKGIANIICGSSSCLRVGCAASQLALSFNVSLDDGLSAKQLLRSDTTDKDDQPKLDNKHYETWKRRGTSMVRL